MRILAWKLGLHNRLLPENLITLTHISDFFILVPTKSGLFITYIYRLTDKR
jgi:hypothetical protein